MKIYYFDSSALVKRYHFEKGTTTVDEIFEDIGKSSEGVISYFAILEITSALRKKLRSKEINRKTFDSGVGTFLSEITTHFSVRPIDNNILSIATGMVIEHGLKAADSLHLATAKQIVELTGKDVIFVASDKELLKAASLEKLDTIDPEET